MNILVSNLSPNVIDNDLLQLFAAFGTVGYVAIVRNQKTGRSKGSAFLEMPNSTEGGQAIRALHRTVLDGMEIAVEEIVYTAGEFNN